MGNYHYTENIGLTICLYRLRIGWTQQQLAAACGWTKAYICQIEKGKSTEVNTIKTIADALEIESYLLYMFEAPYEELKKMVHDQDRENKARKQAEREANRVKRKRRIKDELF